MKKILLSVFLIAITASLSAQQIFQDTAFIKIADGFSFPEGPAWDGNKLYVSNCHSNWIAEIPGDARIISIKDGEGNLNLVYLTEEDADIMVNINQEDGPTAVFISHSKPDTLITLPGGLNTATNGLTFDSKGRLIACDYKGGRILRLDLVNYILETLVNGYNGERFNRPNDLAFDAGGNLYFTDPKSYDKDNRDGAIYAYMKNGELKRVNNNLAFPNGIAFSNDGKFLYVCESAMERIVKFPVNEDGSLGELSEFVKLPGGDPDGIAFDAKGNLYAAHFGGGAVYVIDEAGKIIEKIAAPGKKPSNLEFGGKDMKYLYLTEDETNSVYVIRTNIPGRVLFSSPVQK